LNNNLANILTQVQTIAIHGDANISIAKLCIDSRVCNVGDCFFALSGTQVDGHNFIANVEQKNVAAIVCEKLPTELQKNICYIQVKNAATSAGEIAHIFFNKPSEKLKLVGVTGTNGKTTVATCLHQLFTQFGFACGLISTVHNIIGSAIVPATHTTPNVIALHQLLADMQAAGCAYVFMEVSSHAAHQQRIAGVQFSGALFTNITHDHLDYHGSFDEYIAAKKIIL
jgi:UDP-N-acetylmuramoyl-L-alanyl-D-glutamate--2,6-diaminopimelate ligase